MPRSPHIAKLVRFPPDVYERLEAVARQERRSVTAQVVRFVEQGLADLEREREELLHALWLDRNPPGRRQQREGPPDGGQEAR